MRRLEQLVGDGTEPGGDQDEGDAEVLPDEGDGHGRQCPRRVRQEVSLAHEIGEQPHLWVEEGDEDHRGHCHRRRHRRGEDRAVDADALEALMGEHRERDAEDDARGHGEEREQRRHLEAVAEVA